MCLFFVDPIDRTQMLAKEVVLSADLLAGRMDSSIY
jgi:hypothetical protein